MFFPAGPGDPPDPDNTRSPNLRWQQRSRKCVGATGMTSSADAAAAAEVAAPRQKTRCAALPGEPTSSSGAVRPAESPCHLSQENAELKAAQAQMLEDKKRLKK